MVLELLCYYYKLYLEGIYDFVPKLDLNIYFNFVLLICKNFYNLTTSIPSTIGVMFLIVDYNISFYFKWFRLVSRSVVLHSKNVVIISCNKF